MPYRNLVRFSHGDIFSAQKTKKKWNESSWFEKWDLGAVENLILSRKLSRKLNRKFRDKLQLEKPSFVILVFPYKARLDQTDAPAAILLRSACDMLIYGSEKTLGTHIAK